MQAIKLSDTNHRIAWAQRVWGREWKCEMLDKCKEVFGFKYNLNNCKGKYQTWNLIALTTVIRNKSKNMLNFEVMNWMSWRAYKKNMRSSGVF